MGLLSDMFQQQQNIANNPTQAIRTPQQIAYDNLLNRQANIEQQNKNYQTFNGIMSGVGGLGKIIASSMVKNPMQQAGAMHGISEQEGRLDNLRQAYENVRNAQNKDYVTQAQQQLALARDDEDKAYNRDFAEKKFAYDKVLNDIKNNQWQNEFDLRKDIANTQIDKMQAEITALQNKPKKSEEDIIKLQLLQEQLTKAKRENDPEYLQQQFEQKKQEEEDKKRQEQLKTYVATARDLFNKGHIDNKTLMAIEAKPELAEVLIPKPTWFGFSSSSKNMVLPEKVKNSEIINTDGAYKSSLGNSYTVKISGM
jgi:hypothetical protein